ncbi:hypothetical protein TNCT_332681 [Trichonephila clavata]|uniref:Uncharacterized protein n=1 Tax=Trichonephila clavata TaxID=2740835 RepID=A0A8X6HW87_TRICU|nr:hypothetical protein TNCT_332681 [Trichonephila clavata]
MDLEKNKRSVTYLFRMSTDPMGSRGDPPPSNRVDVRFLSSDVRGQIMEMKPKVRSLHWRRCVDALCCWKVGLYLAE